MSRWEMRKRAKLTTVEAVDAEIDRCRQGEAVAPSERERGKWRAKIAVLRKIRSDVQTPVLL